MDLRLQYNTRGGGGCMCVCVCGGGVVVLGGSLARWLSGSPHCEGAQIRVWRWITLHSWYTSTLSWCQCCVWTLWLHTKDEHAASGRLVLQWWGDRAAVDQRSEPHLRSRALEKNQIAKIQAAWMSFLCMRSQWKWVGHLIRFTGPAPLRARITKVRTRTHWRECISHLTWGGPGIHQEGSQCTLCVGLFWLFIHSHLCLMCPAPTSLFQEVRYTVVKY